MSDRRELTLWFKYGKVYYNLNAAKIILQNPKSGELEIHFTDGTTLNIIVEELIRKILKAVDQSEFNRML